MIATITYTILFAIYVYILWAAPERDPNPDDKQIEGEDRFIKMAMVLNFAWLFSLTLPYFTPRLHLVSHTTSSIVGSVLFAIGFFVRRHAIRTLDHYFTYKLTIRTDHQLIKTGIYKLLRHPSYTGTLFEVIGMMVVAQSPYGLGLFLLSAGTIITIRIRREERMLLQEFGQEYQDYMRQTWRLIPFVF